MEKKAKVVLTFDNEITDMLLLSEEQLRLLQYLFTEDFIYEGVAYEIMGKEETFHEI